MLDDGMISPLPGFARLSTARTDSDEAGRHATVLPHVPYLPSFPGFPGFHQCAGPTPSCGLAVCSGSPAAATPARVSVSAVTVTSVTAAPLRCFHDIGLPRFLP